MEIGFVEAEISSNKNTEVKSKRSWIKHFCSCCCQCCDFSLVQVAKHKWPIWKGV